MLSTIAKLVAKSTAIIGYRGAGRLFKPLAAFESFKRSEGTVNLGSARITFPAFDAYWAQYLWTAKTYEPDVEAIFQSLKHVRGKLLVDCGANIGFWTVKLSDPAYGFSSFIAIEANPYVFDYLRRNVEANHIPAVTYHAAVAETAGRTVHIDCTQGHAVGSVGDKGTPVETVSIDSILRDAINTSRERPLVIVKLDVEGSEIAGIKGAQRCEDLDLLFVYEDWPRSGMSVSKYLLSQGYSIFGVHPDGRREALHTLEEVFDFNRRSFPRYHPSNLVATNVSDLYAVEDR